MGHGHGCHATHKALVLACIGAHLGQGRNLFLPCMFIPQNMPCKHMRVGTSDKLYIYIAQSD